MSSAVQTQRAGLSELVSPAVIGRIDDWQRDYQAATPFRHVVIERFFSDQFCHRLVEAFPPFDRRLAMNENGEVCAKCTHERVPGSASAAALRLHLRSQSAAGR